MDVLNKHGRKKMEPVNIQKVVPVTHQQFLTCADAKKSIMGSVSISSVSLKCMGK